MNEWKTIEAKPPYGTPVFVFIESKNELDIAVSYTCHWYRPLSAMV